MKEKFIALLWLLLAVVLLHAQPVFTSNLPIVRINTNGATIVDEPKIPADMGIIYNGSQASNNSNDAFNHYNGKIGIEIRGQSSQMFPLKSYSIELRNASGSSIDQSILGMPKESDWVLYAPYTDKTLMRNFLAYTMSREMGYWAANCRFVEVILNNEYAGIYVLMERIKRNSGRVNIPKIGASDVSGDALTGGYIISIDKEANGWFSAFAPSTSGNGRIQFSYVYPKETAIVPLQMTYIKSYVDSFENALSMPGYQQKETGWRAFADEPSFIDYLLVNEVSRNVDGYRLSSYFYKDRSSNKGKLVAGPVWDYDLAFRNANYCQGSDVIGWAYQFNTVCPGDFWQVPFWWGKLMSDTAFQSALNCRWQQLRKSSLSNERIFTLVDSVVAITDVARSRHFSRWRILGQYVWPNPQPIANTYPEEISLLKSWISQRLTWLDNNMPNIGACAVNTPVTNSNLSIKPAPNPFSSVLKLDISAFQATQLQMVVVDVMGRAIYSQTIKLAGGKQVVTLPTGVWPSGQYILRYRLTNGEHGSVKLLKL
jgi:hypothetical protein